MTQPGESEQDGLAQAVEQELAFANEQEIRLAAYKDQKRELDEKIELTEGLLTHSWAKLKLLRHATGDEYEEWPGDRPTLKKMTMVEAIDWIINEARAPVTYKDMLTQLEGLRVSGTVQKVPTQASLRAMVSQYRDDKGWTYDGRTGGYWVPTASKMDTSAGDIPF